MDDKEFEMLLIDADSGDIDAIVEVAYYYRDEDFSYFNLQKSFEYFLKGCEYDNIDSYFEVGYCYAYGYGVELNGKKAFEYYMKAANKGYINAYEKIGTLYLNGNDFEESIDKFIEYYNIAAELDSANANYTLGCIYHYGDYKKEVDNELAFKYFQKGALLNDQKCLVSLGHFYLNGYGVQVNVELGLYYYLLADEIDPYTILTHCCLANAYKEGIYVEQDYDKVIEYYKKGEIAECSMCIFNLGKLYYEGEIVEKDLTKSLNYFEKAADLGNELAYLHIGFIYHDLAIDDENDTYYKIALNYFEKAADMDIYRANYMIALIYLENNSIEKDINLIIKNLEIAASKKHYYSLMELAELYEDGIEIKKDYTKSLHYYQLASENENFSDPLYKIAYFYGRGLGVDIDLEISEEYEKMAKQRDNLNK